MEGIISYNGHLCQEVCAYHNVERKTRTGSRTSIASIVFAAWLVDPLASRVENNVVSFPWGKFLMKVLRSVCCTDLPSFTRNIKNIWSLSPLVSEVQYQNLKPIDTKIIERKDWKKKAGWSTYARTSALIETDAGFATTNSRPSPGMWLYTPTCIALISVDLPWKPPPTINVMPTTII